jgi:hypothetical protein
MSHENGNLNTYFVCIISTDAWLIITYLLLTGAPSPEVECTGHEADHSPPYDMKVGNGMCRTLPTSP